MWPVSFRIPFNRTDPTASSLNFLVRPPSAAGHVTRCQGLRDAESLESTPVPAQIRWVTVFSCVCESRIRLQQGVPDWDRRHQIYTLTLPLAWVKAIVQAMLLLVASKMACASSILGFAMTATVSHNANLLKIGQELASRGHNFSLLLSHHDSVVMDTAQKNSFPGLQTVLYEGPYTDKDWASSLSRGTSVRHASKVQHLQCLDCLVR